MSSLPAAVRGLSMEISGYTFPNDFLGFENLLVLVRLKGSVKLIAVVAS